MKINFTLSTLFSLLLLSTFTFGQAERTFVKSFNLQSKQIVMFNLGENMQIIPWDSEILRIQMTVTLETTNDATLKAFAGTGRYTLKSEIKDDAFVVFAPLLQNVIKINGSELNEKINYAIYVPKGVTVLKNGDSNKIVAKLNP